MILVKHETSCRFTIVENLTAKLKLLNEVKLEL